MTSRHKLAAWIVPVFAVTSLHAPAAQAMQSNVWGPWYSTKCKAKPIDSPFGGGNIAQPQVTVPGKKPVQVCQWERKKNDCPKVTSKITKPIKCFVRYDKSREWSTNPPSK